MSRDDLPFCDCRWLERAAENPCCPIEFDSDLNAYSLKTSDGGALIIYHCPFCAGRSTKVPRKKIFATVSREETVRLHELTKDLKTEQEVLARLGKPTRIYEPGVMTVISNHDEMPDEISTYKILYYESHSETANITVNVDGVEKVRITFSGKPVGETNKR